ncbi:pentapeptide repeat-containing protein [Brevibacillus porteri]|uniref:Pentapeptide repeat-containing protein n=1 Tax=Brevibacillus porteri TaxID=2126350 RepID=A0ABX5FTH1_9BACL|nr:pentapeptide repeat-containing protein [Brevibacillus porteri]MED1797445.1 pentapeptide repeat-containing protein [Brevibacillus porteri]MED2129515.1 pentapeptide repeat-containing protein [Brevibacillus porteri]MED2743616.1 pentapeptide repeat-containing protein [Brevibacillus porteri]MED2815174.1 pentapeptide repeat-containing protein [Brevibacillus porteri]MED2897173.1 pentapeptide repeat-containing protein [Brevibacillus porteri]
MLLPCRVVLKQLDLHKQWIDSIGETGERLVVDEVDFRSIDVAEYPLDQSRLIASTFDGMNLKDKDFYAAHVYSSTFQSANLENAIFTKSEADYADFTGANLQRATFVKSSCFETVFARADLRHAKLVNALFSQADFRDANLEGVDISVSWFQEVLFQGAQLKGVTGIEEAFIKSINIGTLEQPVILAEEEAREWLIQQIHTP